MLHLGILLENMRREGYELAVGKPQVVYHTDERGRRLEPIERLVIDVPTDAIGATMQLLGDRRAEMVHMQTAAERTQLEFTIPARGLIGLRNRKRRRVPLPGFRQCRRPWRRSADFGKVRETRRVSR